MGRGLHHGVRRGVTSWCDGGYIMGWGGGLHHGVMGVTSWGGEGVTSWGGEGGYIMV